MLRMNPTKCTNKLVALCLAASTAFVIAQSTNAWSQSASYSLDVKRHLTVAITNSGVDSILADATSVLKVDDDATVGIADIPCDVTLSRSGSVATFTTSAPAVITTQSDLDRVFNEPGFVKVVASIGFCEGRPGTWGGCTQPNSRNMIVIQPNPVPGVVWAHEFGHAVGIAGHRNDNPKNLMATAIGADNRFVNQSECNRFIAGPPAFDATAAQPSSAIEASQSVAASISLIDLAQTVFVDRFPYAAIAAGDRRELAALAPLLFDFGHQLHWPNLATILGILGDDTHAALLKRFLDADLTGAHPDAILRAKSAALLGLGYFLHNARDVSSAAHLMSAANTQYWEQMNAAWLGADPETKSSRIDSLREAALMALALSGRSEIEPLMTNALSVANFHDESRKAVLASDIMNIHREVKRLGLAGYYEQKR